MFTFEEVLMMHESIAILIDDNGIKCDDGHWMTDEECANLTDEEIIYWFNRCYNCA